MLDILFQYRSHALRRYFKTQRLAKTITIAIFLGVFWTVGYGIFEFFRWEIALIVHDAYLRVALPLYMYEGLFLVLFLLVFVSSVIAGMFSLFRGPEDALVMASPRFRLVFWRSYMRTLFSSLWPIVVVAVPAFLGASVVLRPTLIGTLLFVISVSLLAALAVSAAFILIFFVALVLGIASRVARTNVLTIGRVALWTMILVAYAFGLIWARVGAHGDVLRLFAPTTSAATASRVDVIIERFHIFPSHLTTLTLLGAQNGLYGEALVAAGGLALFLVVAAAGLWAVLETYLPLWQSLQEGTFQARPRVQAPGARSTPIRFPRFLTSPLGALFEKEGIIFSREMKSLLWFLFLLSLWAVQMGLEFFVRANLVKYQVDLTTIVARVEALELATAVYFMSAFILRFVFPAFSSERKTAWIIGTSPLKMESVFWAKFLFYGALFSVLMLVFCGVNFTIIEAPFMQAVALIFFALIMVLFLVAFGLGLGAIFPNFETDDPELLSTSLPGLSFIFGSLLYGGIGVYLFYQFLSGGAFGPVLLFDVLTVALTALMLFLSRRSLAKVEFVKQY